MNDPGERLSARIFLRPIGTPLTIGMAGLAIASLVDSGFELQWIVRSQAVEVGLILVAVPFTLQVLAAVFSYMARDGAAGASLGVLASSWLALGLVRIVSTPGQMSGALGLMLLASGSVLALSAAAVARAKPLPALVFVAAAVRFALAGIYELSATGAWQHASGIVGLVVTGVAGYCVLAFELEGQSRAPVLPTFRRARARPRSRTGRGPSSIGSSTNRASARPPEVLVAQSPARSGSWSEGEHALGGARQRPARAVDGERECQSGQQVAHVVLSEVHEREAEQQRVGPAQGT